MTKSVTIALQQQGSLAVLVNGRHPNGAPWGRKKKFSRDAAGVASALAYLSKEATFLLSRADD